MYTGFPWWQQSTYSASPSCWTSFACQLKAEDVALNSFDDVILITVTVPAQQIYCRYWAPSLPPDEGVQEKSRVKILSSSVSGEKTSGQDSCLVWSGMNVHLNPLSFSLCNVKARPFKALRAPQDHSLLTTISRSDEDEKLLAWRGDCLDEWLSAHQSKHWAPSL